MNTHQIIDTAQENRAFISEPKKIIFEENIKDIAIGNGNIAVLTGNRDIYMWGLNTTGQIYGYEADYAYEPFKVPLP